MEMNLAYFEATLRFFESKGFSLRREADQHVIDNTPVFNRLRAYCTLNEDCQFVFERLEYADGREVFYLEITKIGRVRSFSFPLDSWKYHPGRIEFKYRDDPETGLGLAITLDLT